MKFLTKLKPYLPIFGLAVVELILFAVNYVPKTYFLGWDNLFPEFNFAQNLQRSFFAVWEEYRGLGFLDGMSFAANLPHYVFLYITSILLPQSLLRYFFIFFMHFLGGAGMYFLLGRLFSAYSNKKILSLLGALFYLFNIATIQMFFAPYELFSVHFAFLPWLLLFVIKYLENGRKKDLIALALISFISSPQAHVPTIFIVYLFALFTTLAFYILRKKKEGFKKAFLIVIVTFSMSAFWSLPYLYSGVTNSRAAVDSKINQMSTEDVYLKNKARGDFLDVALLRGFWLDYTDSQPRGNNDYIMPVWREHTQKPPFVAIGLILFFLSIIGAAIALRDRNKKFYPFIFMFFFSFLMLGNDIPILKLVFNFFYDHIPLFSQIFRFIFTKFSILYVFSFSILLTLALSVVLERARRFKYSLVILPLGIVLALFYYSLPAFEGQFIYKNLRVNIPTEYFQAVDYFKKQNKNERIAILPQTSYWGWTYTNWGYRGSGFIWYGLPQPTLDGSSFPWSRENENYYWELDQAINSSNSSYFEAVLKKYQVNWVLLDQALISQYSSKASSTDRLQKLIENSKEITLANKIGTISIYRVKGNLQQRNFVSITSNLPRISPKYQWSNFDMAYLENANYVASTAKNGEIFYPFRSIFTGRKQEELEFKISEKGNYFSFSSMIPKDLVGALMIVPSIYQEEISEITKNELETATIRYPQIFLDNELFLIDIQRSNDPLNLNLGTNKVVLPYINKGQLEVRIPKLEGYYSYNSSATGDLFNRTHKNCNPSTQGTNTTEKIVENGESLLRLTNINASNCFDFDIPSISQRISYLVKIKSRNLEGKSLLFSVIDKNSQKPVFESYLPKNREFTDSYFIIPPLDSYGLGYNLLFDNVSIGDTKTVNDLKSVEIHAIPYRFLTSLKIEKPGNETINPISSNNFTVLHPNPSFYKVELNEPTKSNTTLVLSQSYASGWKAYEVSNDNFLTNFFPFVFGKELKEHVLVNNWENGWTLNSSFNINHSSLIYIVYLPQYLEYLGFVILIIGTFYLLKKRS